MMTKTIPNYDNPMLDSADDDTKVSPLMGCDHMTDFTASTVVAKSKFAYFKLIIRKININT